jgi:hypothetical protein
MGAKGDLLAVDQRRALEFFFVGLKEVCDPDVDRDALLYNASVLAHHALVSTAIVHDVPAPMTLTDVFDHFVLDTSLLHDAGMMETAGAQCLMFAGFFETQMRGRHSIQWYSELGAVYFHRAAVGQRSRRKARLLDALGRDFEPWRRSYARLGRELREQPYLITLPEPPSLM